LSVNKRGETEGADSRHPIKPSASGKTSKKNRSSDLGRALRSVYDDTLRESVPDEFLSLMGKLD
jgi:hypothetical protein